jgi:hypothetical protein
MKLDYKKYVPNTMPITVRKSFLFEYFQSLMICVTSLYKLGTNPDMPITTTNYDVRYAIAFDQKRRTQVFF